MSKSKISRDEMRRRVEAMKGGAGVGGSESAAAPVTMTAWAGIRNYECGLCAYATLDVGAMVGHLKAVHGWVESPLGKEAGGQGSRGAGEQSGEEATAVVVDEEQSDNKDEVM